MNFKASLMKPTAFEKHWELRTYQKQWGLGDEGEGECRQVRSQWPYADGNLGGSVTDWWHKRRLEWGLSIHHLLQHTRVNKGWRQDPNLSFTCHVAMPGLPNRWGKLPSPPLLEQQLLSGVHTGSAIPQGSARNDGTFIWRDIPKL